MRTTEIIFLFIDRAPWLHKVPHCCLWVGFSMGRVVKKHSDTHLWVSISLEVKQIKANRTQWAER